MKKISWRFIAAILSGLMAIGYVINFVSSAGYNKPAVFFAWLFFFVAMLFYTWHRRTILPELQKKQQLREEKEFQEWLKSQSEKHAAESH